MSNRVIRRILILGALAIVGIIFIQSYLIYQTYNQKHQEFNQTINIALRQVAESIATYNGAKLPKQNLIQRNSSNYYSVNINTAIDANVLEEYLTQTFSQYSLDVDFEYGVYDCATDVMLYGAYCDLGDKKEDPSALNTELPKFDDLVYYFVVKFPSQEGYILSNMRQSIIFSLIALFSVLFFIYAIYVILRQKQFSDLQKDFINNMTHEFKTPISTIKIASDFISRNGSTADPEKIGQYANIIRDQNARLNDQVEKVLNIARVEGDSFNLNVVSFDITTMLEQIVVQEKLKFEEKGGTLNYTSPDKEIIIEADKLHFANVISNLIDNAFKYRKEHPVCRISLSDHLHQIEITIQDEGIGIKKEDQKKLFSKFYRIPTGNVHNVKGFGLGLFYVKNICDLHDWRISLDSSLGQGSTFTLLINH